MTTELLPVWGVDLKERLQSELRPEGSSFQGVTKSRAALSERVRDHYRCPEDLLDFSLSGELSSHQGHFRFGPNATCYGRSCSGTHEWQPQSLRDARQEIMIEESEVRLPFDPTEIIDNLRLESYPHQRLSGCQNILKKAYYWLRPFTNQHVRKQIQRFHARNWRTLLFPRWPVDTTVEDICETLLLQSMKAKGVDRVPFVWFWPHGSRGCIVMTHDVETTSGRDFCTNLMDIDDSFGIKASFQIVPEERYEVSAQFLETIRNRGFEIGIQDLNHDGRLYDNREEFLRRAVGINRYVTEYGAKGFRSGVLYRRPEWFDSFDFSFDMSIPNVAHLDPQRGGCCTVMPYFIGDVLELPVTTTQDYTLFHVLNERSIDLWKTQVELILEKYGLASFIIHPDYLKGDTRSVYEALLAYLRDLREKTNLWFPLPAEVDRWWRARNKMSIERAGSSWRIVGQDADQAVLAYAKNVDGRLVYEVTGTAGTTQVVSAGPR